MSYNTVIVTVLLIIFITLNYARNKLMIKKVNNKNLHYDKWLTILSTLPQIDSITIMLIPFHTSTTNWKLFFFFWASKQLTEK